MYKQQVGLKVDELMADNKLSTKARFIPPNDFTNRTPESILENYIHADDNNDLLLDYLANPTPFKSYVDACYEDEIVVDLDNDYQIRNFKARIRKREEVSYLFSNIFYSRRKNRYIVNLSYFDDEGNIVNYKSNYKHRHIFHALYEHDVVIYTTNLISSSNSLDELVFLDDRLDITPSEVLSYEDKKLIKKLYSSIPTKQLYKLLPKVSNLVIYDYIRSNLAPPRRLPKLDHLVIVTSSPTIPTSTTSSTTAIEDYLNELIKSNVELDEVNNLKVSKSIRDRAIIAAHNKQTLIHTNYTKEVIEI